MRLRLAPVSLEQANEHVAAWHRHNDPVVGHKFSVGAADDEGVLRAVAIAAASPRTAGGAVRPRLLDLFCGAGGAGMGYHRAGFDVVGVDLHPQSNYPFPFLQADALQALAAGFWRSFDAIHASPPCQAYTHAKYLGNRGRDDHPDLLAETREALRDVGIPYVIENVPNSPMLSPVVICGSSVGLVDLERHRWFETNWPLLVPPCAHGERGAARFPGTPRADGTRPLSRIVNQMASGTTHEMLADAMGIDWIPPTGKRPTGDLRNAIPPAYTELIGHQLRLALRGPGADTTEAAA